MQIYAIISACSWFLGFFFVHVKINSCDGAEVKLFRHIYDFKWLSLRYDCTAAVREERSWC